MVTTCFVCCEDSQYWTLPPCNHTHICWKCCLKLVDGSIFSCPFCKDKPQAKSQLLFVTTEQMLRKDFQTLMHHNPFRSNKNSYYFYSNQEVAQYIEAETSYHCILCGQVHETMNLLKKHLYGHRVQFCDVCLQNRKCMIPQQKLYTDYQLQIHLKQGQTSTTGEIALYHPHCEFCARRFYDLQTFKLHLKMSAHLKCQICDLNCPKLKLVYYKNFQDLQRHHRKSHFVCEVGQCITRKLQNVFASQNLLQEHKRRCHRKYRGDKNEKLDNIILGFNKKQEENFIQFDGIGKDLSHQFTVFEMQGPVQKQIHNDALIDLREFYPQIVKANHNPRLQDIINRTLQIIDRKQLNFAHLPLYKPLQMSSLCRQQCNRLLRKTCSPKQAESILQLFFIKKNDFKSAQDYIQAIQRKMKSYSQGLFFIAFPQLIRNLKPENKNKALMDQLYANRLRSLPVNRFFIFHQYQRYSSLIEITKSTVEEQVSFRLNQGAIDLQVYAKFLKQMSANYYVQKHEQIYWVSKQKITHLYHMIQRCKTKDFLKMNWLLKVGFSNNSYNLLHKFYYSTKKEIQQAQRFLSPLSLQQLSLLNAYLMLCLQSLLDINSFEQSKKNPKPHYLTNIIQEVPQAKRLPQRQLEQLRALQGHSDAMIKKTLQRHGKGNIINQNDCPSLLAPINCNQVFTKTKQQKPQIMLGKGNLPTPWNEERAKLKKQTTQQRTKNEQEFPRIGKNQNNKGNNQAQIKQKIQNNQQEQQDFPVFNFNEKYVTHKLPANKDTNKEVNNWVNFNNKSVNRNNWDEDHTRKKWKERQAQKRQEMKTQKNNELKTTEINNGRNNSPLSKKKKNERNKYEDFIDQDDKYFKMAIQQSLYSAKQEGIRRNEQNNNKQQQTYQIIVPKKANKIQQQQSPKNKKKKKPQVAAIKKELEKQKKELLSLFGRIQQEQEQEKNKRKRSPFRRDISNQKSKKSQIEKSLSNILSNNEKKILSNTKGPVFDDDDFVPLGQVTSAKQQSIITRIIKENQSKQEIEEVRPQKQRHKKKKYRGQQND